MLVLVLLAWRDPLKRTALPLALCLQTKTPALPCGRMEAAAGKCLLASSRAGCGHPLPVPLGVPQLAGGGHSGGPGCNVVVGKGCVFLVGCAIFNPLETAYGEQPALNLSSSTSARWSSLWFCILLPRTRCRSPLGAGLASPTSSANPAALQ